MLLNKTVLVIGGDLRNVQIAKLLSENNKVFTVGQSKSEQNLENSIALSELLERELFFDYIVFPLPISNDDITVNSPFSDEVIKIDDVLSLACAKTHILGGKFSEAFRRRLDALRLTYTDYLLREELAVLNAVPTAEGALQLALEELPVTIYGLDVLVIGYGRISKVLSSILKAMGANVTVSARKFSDIAWIQINGYTPIHTSDLAEVISTCQLIFNTVPAEVLDESMLSRLKKDCLLIDLASKPGGVDFDTAKKLSIKTIWALSLPGKVAPISAGKIIFDTIQNIEIERRYSLE